jgi:diguanylate cyclase (GGDEF)-like protein
MFFTIEGDAELLSAKVRALSRQIPLLYVILILNSFFISLTHYALAPLALSVLYPAVTACFCTLRGISWLHIDPDRMTHEQNKAKLKSTLKLVPLTGILNTVWSLCLLQYGGPYEQGHLALFIALTAMACILCLMHLRAAALQLAVIVIVPFSLIFMTSSNLVFQAMAINVGMAVIGMVAVVLVQHKNFVTMVRQRHDLERTQEETKLLSDENLRLATRDTLTGLPNRRSFVGEFSKALQRASLENGALALLLLDLDGFKAVNDLYGHSAGDSLLVKASLRLKDAMNAQCHFARLGGDEFAVAIEGFQSHEELSAFAKNISYVLSLPYRLPQAEVSVSASIGVAVYGIAGRRENDLFEHADYALYQAKDNAPGDPVFFNEAHHHTIRLLHEIDQNLRSGTLERELSLVYQPIVQTGSLKVVGYEALARWNNEALGPISPAVFIPAAAKSGMAARVTRSLFRKLLADIPSLPTEMTVSFNLSARDLVDPQGILGMVSDIQLSGITARRLQFEVTEASVTADFDKVMKSLSLLRNMGCMISLDNFGSGQSVLSYIYRLPIDSIKIDSSFISQCESNDAARMTLQAIVSLCDSLDLMCVAVGIETESQAELAADLGCMRLQGFHIARPVALEYIGLDPAEAKRPAAS